MQKTRKPMFYGRLGKKQKRKLQQITCTSFKIYKEIRKLYIQNKGA